MLWNEHSNLEGRHSFMSPSNHSWKNYDDAKLISVFDGNKRKIEGTKLHKWAEDFITSVNFVKHFLIVTGSKRTFRIDINMIRDYIEKEESLAFIRESNAKETICMYIADAIKFEMTAEQPLVYDNFYCFGTADAIQFESVQFDGYLLRIHDLKTGETPASIDQLIIYAALFCLEYHYDPNVLIFELRIYQTEQITIYKPAPEEIIAMMNIIVHDVEVLSRYERGEL